jgi:hypothetical protein
MYLPSITSNQTKTDLNIISEAFINELSEKGNTIPAVEIISKMEYLIKQIKASNEFIDLVRTEVEKYGKGLTTLTGVKIELAEVGTKYDFTQCNDDILCELEYQLSIYESKIKERKEFLKTISKEGIDVIAEGGEVKRIFPPSKSSTS